MKMESEGSFTLATVNAFSSGKNLSDGNISGLYYKSFTIIIYDRNDSMIVEPVL